MRTVEIITAAGAVVGAAATIYRVRRDRQRARSAAAVPPPSVNEGE